MAPAVCGLAMLVPLKRALPSTWPGTVDSAAAGATTSGFAVSPPRLENANNVLRCSVAL